jgi:hypothetical protein
MKYVLHFHLILLAIAATILLGIELYKVIRYAVEH